MGKIMQKLYKSVKVIVTDRNIKHYLRGQWTTDETGKILLIPRFKRQWNHKISEPLHSQDSDENL